MTNEQRDVLHRKYHHPKYGEYEIVEYINCERVKVRFMETGYEYYTSLNHIENKEVRDYKHKNKMGGCSSNRIHDKKAYQIWYNMLMRASASSGSYKDVSVCKEWMDFENFKTWMDSQYREKGWHLDKDILFRGNREYRPDRCCFLPPELNTFFENSNNAKGYGMNRTRTKYVAFIRDKGKKVHLGTFDTIEGAKNATMTRKKMQLAELIVKYEDVLNENIVNKLKSYYNA